MARNILRKIIIFLGILMLFELLNSVYYYFSFGEGSYQVFGARDGEALITSWLDENANGIRDPNEPPLPGVCIWAGYISDFDFQINRDLCNGEMVTDKDGNWEEFLPGGSCEDYYVFVQAPDGYQATTDLASNSCSTDYGFVKSDLKVSQKILTIPEFVHQKKLILWIKRIGIGILIASIASLGTIWLEKKS